MRWPRGLIQNAVIGKELRLRLRSRDFKAIVTLYIAVLGIIVIVFLLQHGGLVTNQSLHSGIQLFQILAIFQIFLLLFVTPATIAGTVSGERQQRTWDLLLVTGLSSFDILWGKLLAGLAFNVLLIVASVPLLSAVFLFGGVAPGDVLHTYTVFLATVLLLSITSLFVSVLSYRPTVSLIVSSMVSLALGVGLSLLILTLEAGSQESVLTILSDLGALPADLPPLTPLAQVDPLMALLSVLPSGGDGTLLGDLGSIDHAFGLPLRLPLWGAFDLLTVAISIVVLALSSLLVRFKRLSTHLG
jgi:ABC-type transport system involved in multi-copper enzyme maturation permease subunit